MAIQFFPYEIHYLNKHTFVNFTKFVCQSAIIVGTQRLPEADAVSIKKPQECYKLTSPSDRTALCTLIDVTTVAMDVSIALTYLCKIYA